MSMLFSGPKAPTPQPVTIPAPAPTRDDAGVMGEANAERQRLAQTRGRGATVLAPAGANEATPSRRPTLLGMA